MFILEDKIMKKTVSSSYKTTYQNRIDDFKEKFWEHVKNERERIALSYVKSKIDDNLERHKITSTKSLDDMKNDLANIANLDVDGFFNTKINEIDQIIKDENYEQLLQICNLKKEITNSIATKCLDTDYEEKVKQRIITDKDLQMYLKDKYFSFQKKHNQV